MKQSGVRMLTATRRQQQVMMRRCVLLTSTDYPVITMFVSLCFWWHKCILFPNNKQILFLTNKAKLKTELRKRDRKKQRQILLIFLNASYCTCIYTLFLDCFGNIYITVIKLSKLNRTEGEFLFYMHDATMCFMFLHFYHLKIQFTPFSCF